MKRNFYALFALLTALSGPLALSPQAVSRANSTPGPQEAVARCDDSGAGEQIAPRSFQAHNQPACRLGSERLAAPEDLVVLPEDFNYELFDQLESCQSASNTTEAASPPPNSTEFPVIDSETAIDELCLPHSEWNAQVMPWEGPAVAGIDANLTASPESALPEAGPISFGFWAGNFLSSATLSLSSWTSSTVETASSGAVDALGSVDTYEIRLIQWLANSVVAEATYAWQDFECRFANLSQPLAGKRLTENVIHQAERPFCHCWALSEFPSMTAEEAGIEAAPAPNQLRFASEGLSPEPPFECEAFPNVPQFELQLSEAAPLQNDADGQRQFDAARAQESAEVLDLNQLGEASQKVWEFIKENAAVADRWARDYDFEPFSSEESEKNSNAD